MTTLTFLKLSRKVSAAVASDDTGSIVLDVLKLASETALDIIGSAALGHDFNAFETEGVYAQALNQLQYVIASSVALRRSPRM